MSDINFLANNKKPGDEDEAVRHQADQQEKIVWSEPEDSKPLPKESAFSALSFFKKKLAAKRLETKTPSPEALPIIDRNRIRQSRQKILELIKRQGNSTSGESHKESAPGGSKSAGQAGAKQRKTGNIFLAGLLASFKKKPSHKEALVDYQRVFNYEKNRRNRFVGLSGNLVKPSQQTQAGKVKPNLDLPKQEKNLPKQEKKSVAARIEPSPRDSFFGRFFKLIKVSVMGLFKPGSAKINLREIKQARPEVAAESRPVTEEKIEIKEKRAAEPEPIVKGAPKVLETNLIKGEIITFFDWRKKAVGLIKSILIPVALVSLVYFGLAYYQKFNQGRIGVKTERLSELKERIKEEESSFQKIIEFQNRLSLVSEIFAKHVYWSNFFKFLEDNTIKGVFFTGFSGDTGGNYSLDAIATGFSDISDQVNTLENNQKITSVKTTGGALISGGKDNKSGVAFNLNFSILKSIFTE